jgi:hypothetical protein
MIAQMVNLPTTTSAHSITVDPFNGDVFVPLAGTTAVNPCPTSLGCIAVFGQAAVAAPEPASLTLMMTAFVGFAGLVWSRRRRQS